MAIGCKKAAGKTESSTPRQTNGWKSFHLHAMGRPDGQLIHFLGRYQEQYSDITPQQFLRDGKAGKKMPTRAAASDGHAGR